MRIIEQEKKHMITLKKTLKNVAQIIPVTICLVGTLLTIPLQLPLENKAVIPDLLLPITTLVGESWILQGLITNGIYSLISFPFTNKIIKNKWINHKKRRIKDAIKELETYCVQQLIQTGTINRKEYENKIFIITSKYDLELKDIFTTENNFFQQLVKFIINTNLLDEKTKENIIYKIHNNNIFNSLDKANDFIYFENGETRKFKMGYSDINNKNEDFDTYNNPKFSKEEKRSIFKQTSIVTGIIYISLFVFTSFIGLIFKKYGINSLILINTIIIFILILPILINGIMHSEEFSVQSRRNFYLLLICFLLIIANLICIFSVLL